MSGIGAKSARAVACLAMIAVVSACSGSATPSPQPSATGSAPTETAATTPTPSPAPSSLNLALGTAPPDPTSLFFYFTQAQHLYQNYNLTVDIQAYNGDTTALKALEAGDADVAWTECMTAASAIEAGAKIKIISAFAPTVDYSVVANVSNGISTLADLKGHSVGFSSVGSVSWVVPKLMLESAGVDWNSVTQVAVGGSSARLQALVAKKIDGAVLDQSFVAQSAAYDYLKPIADATATLPNFLFVCEETKTDTISSQAAALAAFEAGSMQGIAWFYGHQSDALTIAEGVLPGMKPDALAAALKYFADKTYWNSKGEVQQASFDYSVKAAVDSGSLNATISYSDAVDNTVVTAAQGMAGH